jgi:hypothetical protein
MSDLRALKVFKVSKAFKVILAQQAQQAQLVTQAPLVRLPLLSALQAPRAHKVIRLLAQQVLLVSVIHLRQRLFLLQVMAQQQPIPLILD